ncbi:MAG: ATP-dependent endonuclease [Proteobacteria bacterium]|nr:ATP-dependent endonuclease [Pseudomonadota bacterium]
MFFGQLPVLVEGDTEYAAFELLMNKYPDQFPLSRKPVLVRARGKHTMLLIMRILSEFRVPFAILHDADTPLRRNGSANGAWTANKVIYEAIQAIRARGVRVVHRISVPGFEYAHLPLQHAKDGDLIETNSKDKPWRAVQIIKQDAKVETSILSVLTDLTSSESEEALFGGDFLKAIMDEVQKWATQYCPKDLRFGLSLLKENKEKPQQSTPPLTRARDEHSDGES